MGPDLSTLRGEKSLSGTEGVPSGTAKDQAKCLRKLELGEVGHLGHLF